MYKLNVNRNIPVFRRSLGCLSDPAVLIPPPVQAVPQDLADLGRR